MVVTLGQQYNAGEKHTVVMMLVIGKEKIFTLHNESTEIFYDVYSETVVSSTKHSTQFTQLVFQVPAGKTTLHCRQVSFTEYSSCCCCCLHIKNRSDLYPVPFSFLLFKAKKRISVVTR